MSLYKKKYKIFSFIGVLLLVSAQELSNDKKVLEAQLYDQMNVISTLRSEVGQLKIGGASAAMTSAPAAGASGDHVGIVDTDVIELRKQLQRQQEETHSKEKQVCYDGIILMADFPLNFIHTTIQINFVPAGRTRRAAAAVSGSS